MIVCLRMGTYSIAGYYVLKKTDHLFWEHIPYKMANIQEVDFPLPVIRFNTGDITPYRGKYVEEDFKNAEYITYKDYMKPRRK